MKRSLEQLRSQSWPTRAEALRALKQSGFPPTGDDYEVREVSPKSWQVAERNDEQATWEPTIEPAPAKPAKAAKTKAPAKAKAPAATPEPEPEPKPEPAPEPEATDEPDKPKMNLTALPVADGPFVLVVEPDHVDQTSAVAQALDASRQLKRPVWVMRLDKHGLAPMRLLDHAAWKALTKGTKGATGPRKRDPNATPNADEQAILDLVTRDEGVLRPHLLQINGTRVWKTYLSSLANRYGYKYHRDKNPNGVVIYRLSKDT